MDRMESWCDYLTTPPPLMAFVRRWAEQPRCSPEQRRKPMKIRLEEILGEFVRREGSEERHGCLSCGSQDGLCVNWAKGVWHCWGCNRGGATGEDATQVMIPPGSKIGILGVEEGPYQTSWGEIVVSSDKPLDGEVQALLERRGYDEVKLSLSSWTNCYWANADPGLRSILAQKLYLKRLHCGWQFISPGSINGRKALIHGRRGLGSGTRAKDLDTKIIVIVEGFWDLLAIRSALLEAMHETHLVQIISLCGNTLSNDQLSDLVRRTQESKYLRMVYVATDNDQPEKTARIWNLLRVHMPCRIAEPLIGLGKDWDEAWQNHHDEALAYWAKRFVYRGS